MTTLAMHEKSWDAIRDRLTALDLTLDIATFADAAVYSVNEQRIPAEEAEIDYLWLRTDVTTEGEVLKQRCILAFKFI